MRKWVSLHTRVLLWAVFIVSAAAVAAWACGTGVMNGDTDAHGCWSTAGAHQGKPEPISYTTWIPVNGYFEGNWYVSPDYSEGHRYSFGRQMSKRIVGGSWVVFYNPLARTGYLGPGQSWSDTDAHPGPGVCEFHGSQVAGWYDFKTYTQARLYKGDSQTNAQANDTVTCYYTP